MYTALYRSERPETFSEIIGQDHIVKILRHQIETNTVSHAYLFCGTRGTGKTTTARVLAKAVNCLSEEDRPCGKCDNCLAIKEGTFIDVIEIDAASNNGVDNVRELRESVNYPPAVGRKKVYIIDEVHMLTPGAANALLKTLEEPPENVMFILATTDPQKLPQTILSRCMRLDFKRVPENVMIKHMERICQDKGVEISEGALRLLSVNADGSVRDGLSILDQCLSAGDTKLDRDDILEFLGTVSEEFFISLTEKVSLHNVSEALVVLDEALREGKDVKQLMKDWMSHYRNLLITKYIKNPEDMLNMSTENIEMLRNQSNRVSLDEINDGIMILSRTINDAKFSTQPRILLELAIVTIASGIEEQPRLGSNGSGQKTGTAIPKTVAPKVSSKTLSKEEMLQGNNVNQNAQRAETPDNMRIGGDFDGDLDQLWREVFEEGEGAQGSFNIIRTSTTLAAMNDHEFKVIAISDFVKDFVERNRDVICKIMMNKTGKGRKLVCVTSESSDEDVSKEEIAEKIAQDVGNKFSIKVDVE